MPLARLLRYGGQVLVVALAAATLPAASPPPLSPEECARFYRACACKLDQGTWICEGSRPREEERR